MYMMYGSIKLTMIYMFSFISCLVEDVGTTKIGEKKKETDKEHTGMFDSN